ncbi:hypothetical protein [Streptomyces sp. SM12]|uniref:hypothetical protein n=1 Tax=Streptomyces sp. SM12 TaxID=1071602 RepID=UPI000CD5BEC6|nr:hypothetical protein [Streptomyces sp. SM12]
MPTPPPIPRYAAEVAADDLLAELDRLDIERASRRTLAIYIGALTQTLTQLRTATDNGRTTP